jgi:hypothetical protein
MKKDDMEIIRRLCMTRRWMWVADKGLNLVVSAQENGVKYGALDATRKNLEADWSVNVDGLKYVLEAQNEKRITIGVVLLYNPDREFVVTENIEQVMQNLQDVRPQGGKHGDFFWINAQFRPARRGMSNAGPDEAF